MIQQQKEENLKKKKQRKPSCPVKSKCSWRGRNMEGSKLRPRSPGSGVSFSVSSTEQHEK